MTDDDTDLLEVAAEEAGQRLDRYLAAHLPALSRSRIQALIEHGQVTLDGATVTAPAHKIKAGSRIRVAVPPPAATEPEAQDLALDIRYEDDDLIVINKPPGMVVHPAPGSPDRTLVNALIHRYGDRLSEIGGPWRPGIVHRIDKDTSGLMVVARTDRAHEGLAAQFAAHILERAYLAVVWGAPTPPVGRIEGAIGRHPANRKKMAVVRRGGKPAVTHYRVLKRFGDAGASLVECRLETGRTHQIRVHMAQLGHPLIGDPLYGRATRHGRGLSRETKRRLAAFPRQALHAFLLGFVHPVTDKVLKFEAELPSDMVELLEGLEQHV